MCVKDSTTTKHHLRSLIMSITNISRSIVTHSHQVEELYMKVLILLIFIRHQISDPDLESISDWDSSHDVEMKSGSSPAVWTSSLLLTMRLADSALLALCRPTQSQEWTSSLSTSTRTTLICRSTQLLSPRFGATVYSGANYSRGCSVCTKYIPT